MNIYLFGATTPTGQAFINLYSKDNPKDNLICFSRNNLKYKYIDFDRSEIYLPKNNKKFIIVSFAPIWKISRFLEKLYKKNPNIFKNLLGLVICSSSSVITKRFSFNKFDKNLFEKLLTSENLLNQFSRKLNISICILQPTLVYGNIGEFKDKNINLIKSLMQLLPFIIIPSNSGLRQPIHAYQLASLALKKVQLIKENTNKVFSNKILIGGDQIISFDEMLCKIKTEKRGQNKIIKCFIIRIPNRIYSFFVSPLILFSPKLYEAFNRLNSDLSGFTKISEILQIPEMKFPVKNSDFI